MNFISYVIARSSYFVIIAAMIALPIVARAQSNDGLVYSKTFIKQSSLPENFKDNFSAVGLPGDYFLSIISHDKNCNLIKVILNGKIITEITHPAVLQKHLIKIDINNNNIIEIQMRGTKNSSASISVMDLNSFSTVYGPETFTKTKKIISSFSRQFETVDKSAPHLLVIEADSAAIKDRSLALIKLNNKIIVNPLDFIFDKKNRFIKPIAVLESNKLEIHLLGIPNSHIKISVLAAESESKPSPGVLSLVGLDTKSFNPVGDIILRLEGASFPSVRPRATVILNDRVLDESEMLILPDRLEIPQALIDGLNQLDIISFDSNKGMLGFSASIWAGSTSVAVEVSDVQGLVSNAVVTAKLGDDQTVMANSQTNDLGIATFNNIPQRTIFFLASSNGKFGSTTDLVLPLNPFQISIEMNEKEIPSLIDNNDFKQGLEGWNIDPTNTTLVPHVEDNSETVPASLSGLKSFQQNNNPQSDIPDFSKMTFDEIKEYRKSQNLLSSKIISQENQASISTIEVLDFDARVQTRGQRTSKISRTFKTKPGVNNVIVRYQFVTSEIPGGFFGSKFNDGYAISLVNSTGQKAIDTNNMNNLGTGAFTSGGYTVWTELRLDVNPLGDVVQLNASVKNVGDDQYDSIIFIDYVANTPFKIWGAELLDNDPDVISYLDLLSISSTNPYFGGNTIINGQISISGDKSDSLSSLQLQIIQEGIVRATADLAPEQSSLISPFGVGGVKYVHGGRLFNLSSSQAGGIDTRRNGTVTLKIVAKTLSGLRSEFVIPRPVRILSRYNLANRYNPRDEVQGGDDWGTPACIETITNISNNFSSIGFKVNDFSNMNGGIFKPHVTHNRGIDVDFLFNESFRVDAEVAEHLLQMARSNSNIHVIGVTYNMVIGDPFYEVIKNETINGRPALNVIKNWPGHKNHFHIMCIK